MAFTTNQKLIGGGILGAIVLVGGGIAYNKYSKKRKIIVDSKKYSDATVGTYNVIETAQQLGNDLGYSYSWINPQSWTENDTAVRDTIAAWPKTLMKPLIQEFATRYGKSLQSECQRLLPASYYQQIRDKFL
jgi:hypothetical protein